MLRLACDETFKACRSHARDGEGSMRSYRVPRLLGFYCATAPSMATFVLMASSGGNIAEHRRAQILLVVVYVSKAANGGAWCVECLRDRALGS